MRRKLSWHIERYCGDYMVICRRGAWACEADFVRSRPHWSLIRRLRKARYKIIQDLRRKASEERSARVAERLAWKTRS